MNRSDYIRHNILTTLLVIGLYVVLQPHLPDSLTFIVGKVAKKIQHVYKNQYIGLHILFSTMAALYSIMEKDSNKVKLSTLGNMLFSPMYFLIILTNRGIY